MKVISEERGIVSMTFAECVQCLSENITIDRTAGYDAKYIKEAKVYYKLDIQNGIKRHSKYRRK